MQMALGLFIVVLCLTSGLWIGANGQCGKSSGSTCDSCPSGWTRFGQRCFMFQANEMEWADAERFCTSLCGNLASIRSAVDYGFMRQLIYQATNSHKTTWVGGNDAVKEGVWMWSDGTNFVFSDWGKGEPNNLGGENCMEINLGGQDYVNDSKCNNKRSFLCAKDAS
ncbi:hypothetical protein L3Q82_003640 [Scortum barcoo]|uniref:Uncharacterized protein n=1 Tax=Scortum barcoo TaxID=214431 RepID=A0ACB8VNM0_9TELE|nr:hypothetical protein L3Q82_003640 [Scortum barcoo]